MLSVRALLPALLLIGVLAPQAVAGGPLPLSPVDVGVTSANNGLQVKPRVIIYTGDSSGFLGGANLKGARSSILWTTWNSTRALGSGFNQLDDCEPSCAGGKFHRYPVKIEMWRPRNVARTLVFTRLTIFYEKGRPSGEPAHYTFTDLHFAPGGFGWGPPSAYGYCTHTQGQKPSAGCQNIHVLP